MNGKEKVEAALSLEGSREVPFAICYEDCFIRDHWKELTSYPWWYQMSPELDLQMKWRREVIRKIGQDFLELPLFYTYEERKNLFLEERDNDIFMFDKRTGSMEKVSEPKIGGWTKNSGVQSVYVEKAPENIEDIDKIINLPPLFDAKKIKSSGKADLAKELLKEFGEELYPIYYVRSPLYSCYYLWGFEEMMIKIAMNPELIEYACKKFLEVSMYNVQIAVALGAKGIWIEDCFSDLISGKDYEKLNLPFTLKQIEYIKKLNLKSIYNFMGNPKGKLEYIISSGADAVALEEGKKNFDINIEDIVKKVNGKCTVLGNVDSLKIIPNGSREELKKEVLRQIAAGKNNKNRFIMCSGSPITPATSIERLHLFRDLSTKLT